MGVFANNNITVINLISEVHINNLNLIGKRWEKKWCLKNRKAEGRWQSENRVSELIWKHSNSIQLGVQRPALRHRLRDSVKRADCLRLCLPKKGKRRNKITGLAKALIFSPRLNRLQYILTTENAAGKPRAPPQFSRNSAEHSFPSTLAQKLFLFLLPAVLTSSCRNDICLISPVKWQFLTLPMILSILTQKK